MFTGKQVKEIREHLHKAQNPVFFFDNDPDGLCSFLLMQRYIEKGKGVPIKSYPGLSEEYFRKVTELNADYIFILDKPLVTKEFFERVQEVNIPVVWIDHHEIEKSEIPDFVNYYNPLFNRKKTNEPVTALCYQITDKQEDLWLGVVGCVADRFVPDFYKEFAEKNPEMSIDSDDGFKIFYDSDIGKIARIFSFALKDRMTNVVSMIKFLVKVNGPHDVLNETPENKTMHLRFKEVETRYRKMIDKGLEIGKKSEDFLFFHYRSDLSVTSEISNELSYNFPDKFVVVMYIQEVKTRISARGKNIREVILKAIEDLEGARGGGHENAVGAVINSKDLEKFESKAKSLVNEKTEEN